METEFNSQDKSEMAESFDLCTTGHPDKFNLSENECNILVNGVYPMEVSTQDLEDLTKIIITQKENLEFRKGFMKEDVKEFIRLLKEELAEDPSYPRKTIDKLAGDKLI